MLTSRIHEKFCACSWKFVFLGLLLVFAFLVSWQSAGRQEKINTPSPTMAVLVREFTTWKPSVSSMIRKPSPFVPNKDTVLNPYSSLQEQEEEYEFPDTELDEVDALEEEEEDPVLNWFDFDLPGIDMNNPVSIWSHDLSRDTQERRTDFQRQNPQMVLIKGAKVGGTTVSLALEHIAQLYNIKLPGFGFARNHMNPACTSTYSLWLNHGIKSDWMERCIPHARFITVLREPVSQALSWEAFTLSMHYYRNYPQNQCDFNTSTLDFDKWNTKSSLERELKRVTRCEFTELRRNITLHLVAHKVSEFVSRGPGAAITRGWEWILGDSKFKFHATTSSSELVAYLKENYFLVGLTERINHVLVLLALHMGWDLSQMYYVYCKPTDLGINDESFKTAFPQLYQDLHSVSSVANEVYRVMLQDFDDHIALLVEKFPEFESILLEYEVGLKDFQQRQPKRHSFKWTPYKFLDGHVEFC